MLCRLTLLGPVGLTSGSRAPHRRAIQQRRVALLAVLATAPRGSASRDRLLGLLWPDRDERTARHLLADSLYVLRQTLGDGAIDLTADTVRLSADVVWTDIAEFGDALAEERWVDALAVYGGEFLEGFYVRNATDFELWAHNERARLRRLAVRAASSSARAFREEGRLVDAITAAERALELEPCDEALFRDLMELLIATTNRGRAEVIGRTFAERLARELGVAPSAETMLLAREAGAIGKGEPIVVVGAAPVPSQRALVTDSLTNSIIAHARHHWNQRTRASVERSITFFTRAVERDSHAVDAWYGLADSWTVMGGRGYAPAEHATARATANAERALALEDSSSSVHTSLGGLNIIRRRWRDAEASLRRAIRIDPHNADAHHWLALTLQTGFGDRDSALREQTIATRLNPTGAMQVSALGLMRYFRREYELARPEMEAAFHLNADFDEGSGGLVRVAAQLGDAAAVAAATEAGLARRNDLRGDLLAEQASALALLGCSRSARSIAREAAMYNPTPLTLALAWASIGDANRAFELLERESFLLYWAPQVVWWDPRFDELRDDRRFARVRRRVEEAWRPEWT
jgi:DNA-binding SARP family transcriptional activator